MGHSMSDPSHGHYRTREELEEQKKRDPIMLFRKSLVEEGVLNESFIKEIERDVEGTIEEAVMFAEERAYPDEGEAVNDVYV